MEKNIEKALQEADNIKGFKGHLEQRLSVFSKATMLGQELRGIAVGFNPSENLGAYSIQFNAFNFDDIWGHIALIGAYEPGRYAEKLAMSQRDEFRLKHAAVYKDKKGTAYVKGTIKTADFTCIDKYEPNTYRIQEVYREIDIPFSAEEFKKTK